MENITLTGSQKRAFEAYLLGKNIFLTGKGGTGKSFLTNYIIAHARSERKNVVVCAPTGIAAINVGGSTIHSVFHPGKGIIEMNAMCHDRKQLEVLKRADLLVIDEISMCRADLFRFICNTIKSIKSRMQLIVVGDFFQLPPVLTEEEGEAYQAIWGNSLYAFETDSWSSLGLQTIELTDVKRQTDHEFIQCLDAIREGKPHFDILKKRAKGDPDPDAITICGTNAEALRINQERLQALIKAGAKNYQYTAVTTGFSGDGRNFPAPERLWLCQGATVIMLANDKDKRWVNGTMAKIDRLDEDSIFIRLPNDEIASVDKTKWEILDYFIEKVELPDGSVEKKVSSKVKASMEQYPMKLAWAISIHKSQGQTFAHANIDISSIFTFGQLYVALSRCQSLEGLHITGRLTKNKVIVSESVKSFMKGTYTFDGYHGSEYKKGLEDGLNGIETNNTNSEEYQRGWHDGYSTRDQEIKQSIANSPANIKETTDAMSKKELEEAGLRRISQRTLKEKEKEGLPEEQRNPKGAGRKSSGRETKIIRLPKVCAESLEGFSELYWSHPEKVQIALDAFVSGLKKAMKELESEERKKQMFERRQKTISFDND